VNCTAIDAHHNPATPTSFDVLVENASAQVSDLKALIADMGLDTGLGTDLQQRLANISKKIGQGPKPPCQQLDDLVQHVRSQLGKPHGPTLGQARDIVAAAEQIEGALGCGG
jgi:hypothetical protein